MAPIAPDNDEEWEEFGNLPSVESIQAAINKRYDNLFYYDKKGERHSYICSVCDEYIMHENDREWMKLSELDKKRHLLSWSAVEPVLGNIPDTLKEKYTILDFDNLVQDAAFFKGLALSPRGLVGKKNDHHLSKVGICVCRSCYSCLSADYVPLYAVVNNNAVGHAPKCLTDLTPVELCLLTPVKGYGYVFSYGGGKQKNLKGTMTFMRVEERKVARGLAQLEAMQITEHVVVLLTGKMTAEQRRRATQAIRVDKLVEAVEWLCKNHYRWKDVDPEIYREEFKTKNPVIVDKSREVESENSNIEKKELFTCFFPEGSVDEKLGGFDSREAFKTYVDDMAKKQKFDISMRFDLERKFANGDDSDILVNSCLLQFPYGRGGMSERRLIKEGAMTEKNDTQGFLQHFTRVAQPVFQEPMFHLISYSLSCKLKLLRNSRLQLRGAYTAKTIADGLNADDLRLTARARQGHNYAGGTNASRRLLSAVDACSTALPHTNEAAKRARSTGETLQHYFGVPSLFLTVTFDDNNSMLLQMLHGTEIDDDTPLSELSDDVLARRASKRKQLRLTYPGLGSLNFEMLLNILTEEVIGWSMRKHAGTGKAGLFGVCKALTIAFEEQGRKTVHGHMLIFIEGLRKLQKRLFFGMTREKRLADSLLSKYHERVVTTSLCEQKDSVRWYDTFDHECVVEDKRQRQNPVVIEAQGLRNLRHKKGFLENNGVYAICPDCRKSWTSEELSNDYIRKHPELLICQPCMPIEDQEEEDLTDEVDEEKSIYPKARMYAKIVQFQRKRDASVSETPVTCINGAYQHHVSCHLKGCFRCNKRKERKKHRCGPKCECRYRIPDLARDNSTVRTVLEGATWYEWNGNSREQPIVEILPKRRKYDHFQNISCRAVSESKFSCNSNVSVITDGPVGQYSFKYVTKSTQEDDSAPYAEVENSIKNMSSDRVYEEDRDEAIRILRRAAFAHNKKNVVGPQLASVMIRHESRFYFSHKTTYCPLKDVLKLLSNSEVDAVAKYDEDGNVYFENLALHYLCRPTVLEDISLKEFFEQYYVVSVDAGVRKRKRGGEDEVFPFIADTGFFKHPSARVVRDDSTPSTPATNRRRTAPSTPRRRNVTPSQQNRNVSTPGRGGSVTPSQENPSTPSSSRRRRTPTSTPGRRTTTKVKQGVRKLEKPVLIKISQWTFPDASKFKQNILTCDLGVAPIEMEMYAKLVLALFMPFRSASDFHPKDPECNRPFTLKLREMNELDNFNTSHGQKAVLFSDENQEFLQNIQDCAYNSLRYKVNEDVLQSMTEPFTNYEGAEEATNDDVNKDDDEEGDDALPYEAFLNSLDNVDTNDNDPTFLAASLQGLSFKDIRLSGRDQCGYNDLLPTTVLEEEEGTAENDHVTYRTGPIPNPSADGGTARINVPRQPHLKDIVRVYFQKAEYRAKANVFKYNPTAEVPDANGSVFSIRKWAEAALLDPLQTRAFECMIASFLLTFYEEDPDDDQAELTTADRVKLRRAKKNLMLLKGGNKKSTKIALLLHGPGGSGKSTVINLVLAYAQEYCELIDHEFTSRTIVVTAMSGVAATLLHGETTHSALGLNLKTGIKDSMIEEWEDTRLVIVDEISFASEDNFKKIYHNMRTLASEQFQPFGGINIVFLGDFSQLEPPGRTPIYKSGHCPEFHGALNSFIELDGTHRFNKDKHWGEMMRRFREGEPTLEDIQEINETCLISPNRIPPSNVQVACHRNSDRDAVNCATFERFCEVNGKKDGSTFYGATLILMDSLEMENGAGELVNVRSNAVKNYFYSSCGENNCTFPDASTKRVDPVLKCYPNAPFMLTQNKAVLKGQANGSRTFYEKSEIKVGEFPIIITLACGVKVRAFFASQVASITLRHEMTDISPPRFEVTPESFKFGATLELGHESVKTQMKGLQFPIVSNTATTGHKLQGVTATNLLANDWFYGANWPYVVLSRVKTMLGLYIKQPLSEDLQKYKMSADMKEMIQDFRENLTLEDIDVDAYNNILLYEANNARAANDAQNNENPH